MANHRYFTIPINILNHQHIRQRTSGILIQCPRGNERNDINDGE